MLIKENRTTLRSGEGRVSFVLMTAIRCYGVMVTVHWNNSLLQILFHLQNINHLEESAEWRRSIFSL